jgi:hypothetical protein
LKKLPEYLRLQWGQYLLQVRTHDVNIQQFADWVITQNGIVSKVEIENEATQPTTERVQFVETVNINLYIVINSKKVTSNEDKIWLRITDSVLVVRKDMLLGNVRRKRLVQRMTKHLEVYTILIQSQVILRVVPVQKRAKTIIST